MDLQPQELEWSFVSSQLDIAAENETMITVMSKSSEDTLLDRCTFSEQKLMKERMIISRPCVNHPIGSLKGTIQEVKDFHLNHSTSISRL
jgi:hypothetical protein